MKRVLDSAYHSFRGQWVILLIIVVMWAYFAIRLHFIQYDIKMNKMIIDSIQVKIIENAGRAKIID